MFVDEHRDRLGVEPICRTLEISASDYYERRGGRRSARSVEDERPLARIKEAHEANYCAYGYRRMWIALRRQGEEVGRGHVQRLMKVAGIQGAERRGEAWRTTTPDPRAHRRPDLVGRDFSAAGPDRLWAGDFTYLRSWEGASSFAFVIDASSRRVVGRQPASHMRTDLVLDALRMALGRRRPGADIELVADRVWRSRSQLELAVVEYISWFNHERLHESLGDIPPVEFEDLYVRQEV
jgi:putative transposase